MLMKVEELLCVLLNLQHAFVALAEPDQYPGEG
jgi:hypothetical protein